MVQPRIPPKQIYNINISIKLLNFGKIVHNERKKQSQTQHTTNATKYTCCLLPFLITAISQSNKFLLKSKSLIFFIIFSPSVSCIFYMVHGYFDSNHRLSSTLARRISTDSPQCRPILLYNTPASLCKCF